MENQKLENILNLALSATPEERRKSMTLNVGYEPQENTWELIVKYHGDIARIASEAVMVEELIAGYAIITIAESLIPALADLEEIEYIEKPKRLFFSVLEAKRASCILPVTIREPYLSGAGTIIAIADSGIDYAHPDFINEDGSTRILNIWDQTMTATQENGWYAPEGYTMGVEFDREQINEALLQQTREERLAIVPSFDTTGHGTAVAGIAAGNGRASQGINEGVAPRSELIVVKLGNPRPGSFPKTTELMRALAYIVNKAIYYGRPVAINLSFGNTYGSHRGTSLLERFLDNISEVGKNVICVGAGNEGAAMGHTAGNAKELHVVELSVGQYERTLNVQLWKSYVDRFTIEIISPGGIVERFSDRQEQILRFRMEGNELLIYVGEPRPYSVHQEIYIEFLPVDTYLDAGIWQFRFLPENTVRGQYQMYLPSSAVVGDSTRFFRPTPEMTLTIPSTSQKVITVGAYNSQYESYADFSGRGYVYTEEGQDGVNMWGIKPDIAAPGVNIETTMPGGGYNIVSGTSFAAPFVTGSASLMMEWGIVRENDVFLYGEKVKAYLQKGARPLRGEAVYPNPRVGYGALCLADSLPL